MPVASNGTSQSAEALLTLKCPLAMRRMTLPARGHGCEHIQCFDLESYLKYNEDCGSWQCPICCAIAIPNSLEIDHYMWAIIRELSASNVDQVYIDSMGNWRPFIPGESEFIRPGTGVDASLRMMSKFNTTLPTVQSWSGNVRGKSGTCQPPASPSDSMIPFSPLSVASEYGIAASPRQQANTPDCIIISSSPAPATEVSNVLSPPAVPCNTEVMSSPAVQCTGNAASAALMACSTNGTASLSTSRCIELAPVVPCSQKSVTSSVGTLPARDPDRSLVSSASLSSAELGQDDRSNKAVADENVRRSAACPPQVTSRPDSLTMKFNCALFSKEDEQLALEDILSDAMPDLSDLIPLTTDGAGVVDCPLPEDDFLL